MLFHGVVKIAGRRAQRNTFPIITSVIGEHLDKKGGPKSYGIYPQPIVSFDGSSFRMERAGWVHIPVIDAAEIEKPGPSPGFRFSIGSEMGSLQGHCVSKVWSREIWGSDSRTISAGERTIFYRSVMCPVINSI